MEPWWESGKPNGDEEMEMEMENRCAVMGVERLKTVSDQDPFKKMEWRW